MASPLLLGCVLGRPVLRGLLTVLGLAAVLLRLPVALLRRGRLRHRLGVRRLRLVHHGHLVVASLLDVLRKGIGRRFVAPLGGRRGRLPGQVEGHVALHPRRHGHVPILEVGEVVEVEGERVELVAARVARVRDQALAPVGDDRAEPLPIARLQEHARLDGVALQRRQRRVQRLVVPPLARDLREAEVEELPAVVGRREANRHRPDRALLALEGHEDPGVEVRGLAPLGEAERGELPERARRGVALEEADDARPEIPFAAGFSHLVERRRCTGNAQFLVPKPGRLLGAGFPRRGAVFHRRRARSLSVDGDSGCL